MAAFAFPPIDPVAFHLGPVAVRWYGLAYLVGFLFAWWMLKVVDERWEMGLGPDGRTDAILASVIGVIAGGRLGYVLVYGAGAYLREPLRVFALWDGGMSFHGALAGILLAAIWVSRRSGVSFLRLCDAGAAGVPLGLLLGRLANFVNGELWGRTTSVPWGVVFPGAGPVPRHPSQLYEAGLEGVVLLVVMLLLARTRRPDGELFGWLVGLYGVFRIFVEFFREPDIQVGFVAGAVTMGQVLSVPMVALGIWLVWRARTRGRASAAQAGGASADS
ncbi:MAG: prolipoprotein diacylglyceryl transferase [Coriobacteriia bacterium]|nr:prolipoprotein diacylglyceryl transferase [Coriobacteriia bacterium]